jgi:2-phosphoglycerate kinase
MPKAGSRKVLPVSFRNPTAWREPGKGASIMKSITKRSGKEEKFQSDKIVNSMQGAGISPDTARQLAADIKHHEGITTSEVRNRVIGAIKNKEPQSAKRYESHPRRTHTS